MLIIKAGDKEGANPYHKKHGEWRKVLIKRLFAWEFTITNNQGRIECYNKCENVPKEENEDFLFSAHHNMYAYTTTLGHIIQYIQ